MDPGQQIAHEGFREAFDPVQALQEQSAEDFHDGGRVGHGKRQEPSVANEDAIGNQGMGVRIEVGAVAAISLDRDDAAGANVCAVKECPEGFQNRAVGGLREQAKQLAVVLDQTPQDAGDGKGPVAMRDRCQDLRGEFLGEQDRAFGLAARAEIPRASTERQQMLGAALGAANPREAALKAGHSPGTPPRSEPQRDAKDRNAARSDLRSNGGSCRSGLQRADRTRIVRVPRPVLRRRFCDEAAAAIPKGNEVRGDAQRVSAGRQTQRMAG